MGFGCLGVHCYPIPNDVRRVFSFWMCEDGRFLPEISKNGSVEVIEEITHIWMEVWKWNRPEQDRSLIQVQLSVL